MFRMVSLAIFVMLVSLPGALSHEQAALRGNTKSISFAAFVGQTKTRVIKTKRPEIRRVQVVRMIDKPKPCSAAEAAVVAREVGIRFQTIQQKKYSMKVSGYRQGRPASIKISRAPGCFVLD